MRAAILTALMNFTPAAPVDIFRFLRVPAIVWTMRRTKTCQRCESRQFSWSESRSRRSWSASAASSRRR